MTNYKKAICYGTSWRVILTALAPAYNAAVIINYCKDSRMKPKLITVILLSAICIILTAASIISLICYFIRLKKIKNSCEYSSFEETIEENGVFIEGCHFFLSDFFLTLEIPAKIYYMDISEIKYHSSISHFLICIRTRNNKKYYIRRFYAKLPFWSYIKCQNNFKSILSHFRINNPDIKFSRCSL